LVNGRPFLVYVLEHLQHQGVKRVILSIGYESERFIELFKVERSKLAGMELEYAIEPTPFGTGGALSFAGGFLKNPNDDFLVVNGDTFFPINTGILELARTPETKLVVALRELPENSRYGGVHLTPEGWISEFGVSTSNLVNGGVLRFHLTSSDWKNLHQRERPWSFEKELLPDWALDQSIRGVVFHEPFLDIGVPVDYARAAEFVSEFRSGPK
jgi:D-glycero-alpha-D-manno-heptose 1-phosphate guanylyltransferase